LNSKVVASQKLEPMLGVFQKLIASKLNDHEGFNLIQSLVEFLPSEVMINYNKPIYTLLFQRLTSSKTIKFIKSFITFMCLYVTKFGGASLIEICDSIQVLKNGTICQQILKGLTLTAQFVCNGGGAPIYS